MFPNPDINLDLIRCFLTVVESGGFTQASKRLHVTQSGIYAQNQNALRKI